MTETEHKNNKNIMYKADSKIAEEFIDHQEILDTMSDAETHKSNRALIESLID